MYMWKEGPSKEGSMIPKRLFGKLVSQGERVKLQLGEKAGGCWMIKTEYVQKLIEGRLSDVYFTWVPNRPGWKSL